MQGCLPVCCARASPSSTADASHRRLIAVPQEDKRRRLRGLLFACLAVAAVRARTHPAAPPRAPVSARSAEPQS